MKRAKRVARQRDARGGERERVRQADNSARSRVERSHSRSRAGGGSGLGAVETTDTTAKPVSDGSTVPRPGRHRFSSPILVVLVACTSWALILVAPVLLLPYLALMAVVFCIPRPKSRERESQQRHSRAVEQEIKHEDGPSQIQMGDPALSADDGESSVGSSPRNSNTKMRRGRLRAKAKPKTDTVPEIAAATWVRVGPGKFVRLEVPVSGEGAASAVVDDGFGEPECTDAQTDGSIPLAAGVPENPLAQTDHPATPVGLDAHTWEMPYPRAHVFEGVGAAESCEVSAERTESSGNMDVHYGTTVYESGLCPPGGSTENPENMHVHAVILERSRRYEKSSVEDAEQVSYTSEPTVIESAVNCGEIAVHGRGVASDLHAQWDDTGSSGAHAGDKPVQFLKNDSSSVHKTGVSGGFIQPGTRDEAEVGPMFLRRVRDEDRFDGPPVWQRESPGGVEPSPTEDSASLDARARARPESADDSVARPRTDAESADVVDHQHVEPAADDLEREEDGDEELEVDDLPVCPPCRPWPRVRPASSRGLEARERGRDPRPSRSSTPGWPGRSATRRGPVSRHRLSRPSAF